MGHPRGPTSASSMTSTVVGIAESISTPETGGWLSPTDITRALPAAQARRAGAVSSHARGHAADLSAAVGSITR